jgi:HEAT repeat protein
MDLLQKLAGGDRRSIGRADEVAAQVLDDLDLLDIVFEGILSLDPVVRMRAADVAEKVSAAHPECLRRFKAKLLGEIADLDQQEVRWHVAQMLPRLELSDEERAAALDILFRYLEDQSRIVKTFAMQALADLALDDQLLRPRVIPILQQLTATGSPAMRSRGRKLLEKLGC